MTTNLKGLSVTIVKVKAPDNFAAFCVAINEPFYFLNGAYYFKNWQDAEMFRAFCLVNGVRERDLAQMNFSEVEVETANGRNLITFK